MFDEAKIDEVDKKIINLLQKNPDLSTSEIAEKVYKTETSVGARITKLKRENLLDTQIGVNYKKNKDICLTFCNLTTKNSYDVLEKAKMCPFVFNAFNKTGSSNIIMIMNSPDIDIAQKVIDHCFRSDPNIKSIKADYIITSAKDLILPISFEIEKFENGCEAKCKVKQNEINRVKNLYVENRTSKPELQSQVTMENAISSVASSKTNENNGQ